MVDPRTYPTPKDFAGRAGFQWGSDFDNLQWRGISFLLEHRCGLGIGLQWDSFAETQVGASADRLHLADLNLLYRLIEGERFQWRAGLGVDWIGDTAGTDAGINFTTQADLYPLAPWHLSGELDVGALGDAEALHAAVRAGVCLDRWELFGGYEHREIGGVRLGGPVFGLQVAF